MARLPELLRRFQLPSGASSAELRRAYYRRAKRLHPDLGGSAEAFRRLREDYEEATRLFETSEEGQGEETSERQGRQSTSWRTEGGVETEGVDPCLHGFWIESESFGAFFNLS